MFLGMQTFLVEHVSHDNNAVIMSIGTSFQDVFSGLIILMEILQIGFCRDHPICEQHLLPSIFISMSHFIWTCKWMMFHITLCLMFSMPQLSTIMWDLVSLFDIYIVETYGVKPKNLYIYGTCEKHGQRMQ
jgi:hypothetical protein